MNAVQIDTKTESKSHDQDLASYLDKLLRPEPEPPQQVQPVAVQEQQSPVVLTEQHHNSLSDDRAPRPWMPSVA